MALLLEANRDIKTTKFYTPTSINIQNMRPPVFDIAAGWVIDGQKLSMPAPILAKDVAETLEGLYAAAARCTAAVMVPDLFPGSALEVVVIPALAKDGTSMTEASAIVASDARVTASALAVIGHALASQFQAVGSDMARYAVEGSWEAIAYLPAVRSTVLQATGLVLLHD